MVKFAAVKLTRLGLKVLLNLIRSDCWPLESQWKFRKSRSDQIKEVPFQSNRVGLNQASSHSARCQSDTNLTKTWRHPQLATFTQQLECPSQSPAFAFPRHPFASSWKLCENFPSFLPSTIPPPPRLRYLYSSLLPLLPTLLTNRHGLH